jgi:hypothetical protein
MLKEVDIVYFKVEYLPLEAEETHKKSQDSVLQADNYSVIIESRYI